MACGILLLALTGLALAGCSHTPKPTAQGARATLTVFWGDMLSERYADACAQLSPASRAHTAGNCERLLAVARHALTPAELTAIVERIPTWPVRISGNRATVAQTDVFGRLVWIGGRWLIGAA